MNFNVGEKTESGMIMFELGYTLDDVFEMMDTW